MSWLRQPHQRTGRLMHAFSCLHEVLQKGMAGKVGPLSPKTWIPRVTPSFRHTLCRLMLSHVGEEEKRESNDRLIRCTSS